MKRSLISVLAVSMIIMGGVVVYSSSKNRTSNEYAYADSMDNILIEYTPDKLNDLYMKYNITENDIRFAKGELPHFLEGTILDGNTRVIVSETSEPPEGEKEGADYDIVISIDEAIAIEEDAREKYIKKYGVDPANPKLDNINDTLLPVEEVKRLVKQGVLIPSE